MRPSAARLIVFGAAGSLRRLVGIAAGVALGTGMMLVLLGTYLHMPDRDTRVAWMETGPVSRTYYSDGHLEPLPASDDEILVNSQIDYVDGETFAKFVVATTPSTSVAYPEGLKPLKPGEYYASPALARLVAEYPTDQLARRLGTQVGVLPDTMLKGPDQAIALVGAEWDDLAASPDTTARAGFETVSPRVESTVFRIIVAVGSVALLVPALLLIAIVSQLGAAQRSERLATVRLIGAGRRAMATLAAIEMGSASAVGAVVGIGVCYALVPPATLLPVNGSTSFRHDLMPPAAWIAITVVAMTALGAGTAWWRTWRDEHGALGAVRERAEKPATAWRLVLLVVGLAMFTGSSYAATRISSGGGLMILGLAGGFAFIAFGIVVAGSWLTKVASHAFARSARTAPSLVAAGRLARHPRATFRSVAGVVVAVFVVSVLSGVIGSVTGVVTAVERPGDLPLDAVIGSIEGGVDATRLATAGASVAGVERVITTYTDPASSDSFMTRDDAVALGVPDLPGSPYIGLDVYSMLAADFLPSGNDNTPVAIDALPSDVVADHVIVLTDGSSGAIERARTALDATGGPAFSAVTRADYAGLSTLRVAYQLSVLAYVGMAIAIAISAVSLTVATISAALDRKRTFGLLRLGGMPVRDLRITVALEAALPLAVTLIASAGLGFGVAAVLIYTLGNGLYFTWPDPLYWWALAGSVAIAAVAVTGSFGIVRRSTEITSTRFE